MYLWHCYPENILVLNLLVAVLVFILVLGGVLLSDVTFLSNYWSLV